MQTKPENNKKQKIIQTYSQKNKKPFMRTKSENKLIQSDLCDRLQI